MYSVYCTTIKLIQILQFALTCAATLISELIFRYIQLSDILAHLLMKTYSNAHISLHYYKFYSAELDSKYRSIQKPLLSNEKQTN